MVRPAKERAMSQQSVSFPNESPEYRAARDRLLQQEVALRRQIEAVAAARRALPPGGPVAEDYVFSEGEEGRPVRLSQLFGDKSTLVLYSYMYGPDMAEPCPFCTSMLDCLERAARHAARRVSLAVVAKSPITRFLGLAKGRGWSQFRLLSSAGTRYNADYHGEDAAGNQRPMLNVFTSASRVVRHAYGTEMRFAPSEPGQDARHVDAIWPLWGLLDFTPDGRGELRPGL
jgi:predicted dithiol-disulfide oxidoreductase (DUF899 family)